MPQSIGNFIDRIQIGNDESNQIAIGSSAYGVCTTAANEQHKTVNIPGFYLNDGTTVHIKFNNNNLVSSPTLNISNTGAKAIMQYGDTPAGALDASVGWYAGSVLTLTYDGTVWIRDQGHDQISTSELAGILSIAHGGTNSNSVNAYGVVYGNNDGSAYTSTAAPTNGQVLIGRESTNSNVTPSWYSGLLLTGNGELNNPYGAVFAGSVSINGTLVSTGHVGIGSAPDATYQLYINGDSLINGNLIPTLNTTTQSNTLGSSTNRWAALYLGTTDDYGDEYTPIYWNDGVPTTVTTIQRESFSISPTTNGTAETKNILINNTNVTDNSQIVEIVVDAGASYLNSAIDWTIDTTNDVKKIKLTAIVTNTVSGYILFRK